ncbi:MAG: hypothetical protein K6A89_03520 [Treponema sp.]|nr:hypothetical protein [Treponema sp.]
MKKFFIPVLFLFTFTLASCSQFNIFTSISLGSDIEDVKNILDQNKINYTFYPTGGLLFDSYDSDSAEDIANLIVNEGAGMLGEMLYKDSFFFWHNVAGLKFEAQLYFYDYQFSNVELKWYLNYNPSEKNGYLASKKLRDYINSLFPDCKFEPVENHIGYEVFAMQISENVTITITADQEALYCVMEDTELQKPYKNLHDQVEVLVKELRSAKK